jgi:SpoVK/Ycf46/Vps4 family AAA+-type ATPase
MHQSQHASCALDTAGNESILDMRQQGATIGAAALPDTINFVTPPPKTSQTTTSEGENGETTTAYSETDSMQSERSTVIVDSMESEKRRDEDMPVTTTTRFSDIIGHASVKLRIDEMLLPLALPPSLSESILTGVRSLPACLLLYGPPGCGKVRVDGNDFLCSSLQYRST